MVTAEVDEAEGGGRRREAGGKSGKGESTVDGVGWEEQWREEGGALEERGENSRGVS